VESFAVGIQKDALSTSASFCASIAPGHQGRSAGTRQRVDQLSAPVPAHQLSASTRAAQLAPAAQLSAQLVDAPARAPGPLSWHQCSRQRVDALSAPAHQGRSAAQLSASTRAAQLAPVLAPARRRAERTSASTRAAQLVDQLAPVDQGRLAGTRTSTRAAQLVRRVDRTSAPAAHQLSAQLVDQLAPVLARQLSTSTRAAQLVDQLARLVLETCRPGPKVHKADLLGRLWKSRSNISSIRGSRARPSKVNSASSRP
jgi:hypothetical protein